MQTSSHHVYSHVLSFPSSLKSCTSLFYVLHSPSTSAKKSLKKIGSKKKKAAEAAETSTMADRDTTTRSDYTRQVQVHPQQTNFTTTTHGPAHTTRYWGGSSSSGPTASQMIALVTLVPVSGTLLVLAGLILVGSVIGLAVATPLAVLFSPVLVPAVLLVALAVTGFLSSGAFGLTGLSWLSRVTSYLLQVGERIPEELDYAKRRVADAVAYTGQKTKDVGQTIESKARESGTTASTASR